MGTLFHDYCMRIAYIYIIHFEYKVINWKRVRPACGCVYLFILHREKMKMNKPKTKDHKSLAPTIQ